MTIDQPDSCPARVWLGHRKAACTETGDAGRQRFYELLGRVFLPATVQMMAPLGLTAYLPMVVPPVGDPAVPDEVALVFYASREAYRRACQETVGGRAYALLHETVFNFRDSPGHPASHSAFPECFTGSIKPGEPSFLFPDAVDWQQGRTMVLVGICQENDRQRCITALEVFLCNLRQTPPAGLDGMVFVLSRGCLVSWCHWTSAALVRTNLFHRLPGLSIVAHEPARDIRIPGHLTESFAGLDIRGGECFNLRFPRRWQE